MKPPRLGSTRTIISLTWFLAFSAGAIILLVLFEKNWFRMSKLFESWGSLVGCYGSNLGVILGFYFGHRGLRPTHGKRTAAFFAIGSSFLWSFFVVAILFSLIKGSVKIEDVIEYLNGMSKLFSFLPTTFISYYFGSEARMQEPAQVVTDSAQGQYQ